MSTVGADGRRQRHSDVSQNLSMLIVILALLVPWMNNLLIFYASGGSCADGGRLLFARNKRDFGLGLLRVLLKQHLLCYSETEH